MTEGRDADSSDARPVVLCADDYALAPGVSAAIRALLDRGRLSATGCMTVSAHWEREGAALAPYRDRADLGLHITLTALAPLGPMPVLAPAGLLPGLGRLAALAYAGRLPVAEIAGEIDRQMDRFEAVIGAPPRFLDGHQHVHVLPAIGEVVLARAKARLGPGGYVRYPVEPAGAILARGVARVRALAIAVMARGFARRGRRAGVAGNRVFRGVRDFAPAERYAELFPRFLLPAVPEVLVACHPGRVDAALAAVDPVTGPREDELAYFLSDAFPGDLAAAGVRLARFGG